MSIRPQSRESYSFIYFFLGFLKPQIVYYEILLWHFLRSALNDGWVFSNGSTTFQCNLFWTAFMINICYNNFVVCRTCGKHKYFGILLWTSLYITLEICAYEMAL